MDRLHSMRVFARVIDEGSFAAAARELDLSAAAVTRLVADLEEHLAVRLMNRTTRRLSLTDVGQEYLERIRLVLSGVEEAEALATASSAAPRGHVRVVSGPAFAVHQLAKHVRTFRDRYPLVSIELSVPGPIETVVENFDVSIVIESQRPLTGDFIARRLARSEVIACAAPEYLNRRVRPQHPRDLVQHELLFPSFARDVTFHRGAQLSEPADSFTIIRPTLGLNTIHSDTLLAAALAGLGITALPSFVVETALQERALERVLPQWHLLSTTLYACIPTRKYVPLRTRAFIDFLVETFGGDDQDPWLTKPRERRSADRSPNGSPVVATQRIKEVKSSRKNPSRSAKPPPAR